MDKVTGDIWIEKYRPKSLSEMVGQEAIVDLLRAYVVRKSLPHLLFAGPPGTGKTTAALALAHDLFGAEWRESFLELNASVTGETPVRVRIQGRTQRTTMGDLATRYLSPGGPDATRVKDVEILSVDRDHKVGYQPVSVISRHRVSRLANILVEGGSVRTSLNHSVMILDKEGRLAKIQSSELKVGDFLQDLPGGTRRKADHERPLSQRSRTQSRAEEAASTGSGPLSPDSSLCFPVQRRAGRHAQLPIDRGNAILPEHTSSCRS
ncbi:MAG: AAA family ATPase [Candidatus Thermoplasmatota archaeon]|nr:AAA family ATPase [Candidatus Thermoplasmatota archaeon]